MHTPTTPQGAEVSWAAAVPGDAAELSDLFNAITSYEETPERLSPDSMAHELEAYFDPLAERTIVARDTDDVIVGYSTAFHRPAEADEHRVYVNVYVAPGSRDRGLEDSMMDWAVATGTDLLDATDATKKYVCGWLYKKQEQAAQRFAARRFEAVRHWWEMERFLAKEVVVAPEDGFVVVPWEDQHAEPARLVYNAAFADHWGSAPMDSEIWQKLVIGSPNFRMPYSFVAIADGEVVGYAANEAYPED